MNEAKRVVIYQYNFIDDLQEFKKIMEREKENDNIKECYLVVKYYNNDMQQFKNINDCIDYIKEDYKNNKEAFYLELSAYSISAMLYTKTKDYKGLEYEYCYNMDLLGLGGVI